ncbi:uncharacterized protein [Eurosta solidaginis]|uniref:uncharacterized protein isoform X2 n=1 Tax=Eurosta solidaginis TaxID=178769 RepID=UPI003530D02C
MHSTRILYTFGVLCAMLSSSFGTNNLTNCSAGASCSATKTTTLSTAASTKTATISSTTESVYHSINNNVVKEKRINGSPHSVPIDPLFVREFEVIEDRENITPLTVKINNITVTGLSEANIKSVNFKDKEYDFKMTYSVPKIRLNGHYTAQGQILLLKIDTYGDMFMEILDGFYTVSTKVKLRTLEKQQFFDLRALQFNVDSIKDLHLYFANLFKDKVLNDNTNAVFNGSWRVFFEIFKPKIEAEINKVLLAHFRSVFGQVPAEFFIGDVTEATKASRQ